MLRLTDQRLLQIWSVSRTRRATEMFVANILWCLLLLLSLDRVHMVQRNVALWKPTTQSGTYEDNWHSYKAVDGKLQEVEDYKSCTHTNTSSSSWWVVDLYHHYHIHTIRIQNRIVVPERLTDFYVYISRHNPVPMLSMNDPLAGDLCFHYPGTLPKGDIQTLSCDSMLQGRFVYVWKPENSYLTLCEVEVLVDDVDDGDVVGSTGEGRIEKRKANAGQIHPGTRSSVIPIYSKVLTVVSPLTCCRICMSEPASEATHFQINLESGACECIQDSDFDDQDLALSPGADWDLWDMQVISV